MEKKQVSYEYISFIVDLLEQRVCKDYGCSGGVGRGGLIPATMLAYKLKKKVISFSLYGNDPKYCVGAIKNAKLAKYIYPDWVCRFKVKVSHTYLSQLIKPGLIFHFLGWHLVMEFQLPHCKP